MESGGGARYAAAQEQGEREEKEKAGRQPGGMKFRVSARAPHGVGALLLIGGAVLAGAAVVAWRHARRGQRDRHQPAKGEEEVLENGGGVAEEETVGASPQEIDRPDDNSIAEDETKIGSSNGMDNVGVTEEIQEVHDDAEIVVDESFQNSEQVQNIDLDSGNSSTEMIPMHDDESERVEKFDQDASTELPEIATHDMEDGVTAEEGDESSMKDDTENENNATENDSENDQDPTVNHMENDNPSINDLKKEIAPNDDTDVEASDECSHNISRPGIILDEQSLHGDGEQEAESMENSPRAQLMMHPEQLLDDNDTTMDKKGETAETEPEKLTISDKDVHQHGQEKAMAESAGLASSPALSSTVKAAEKKEPEFPGRIETGMKFDQDYMKGELKEHGLMTKGGATPGGAVVTMDRRSSSMAILALIFALTIGITIFVRLYAPPRATKLQMDLQEV